MVEVSVILDVDNNQIFLNESLNSILNQTLKDIEIICLTKNSEDFPSKYKEKNITIKTTQNDDISYNINKTIKEANGKYVYITNTGCILEKDAIKKLYEKAEKNNSEIAISDIKIIEENEETTIDEAFPKLQKEVFNYEQISDLTKINTTTINKIFRTSFIKENNIKFTDNNEKTFTYNAIFKAQSISYHKEALTLYNRYHEKLININDNRLFDIIPCYNDIIHIFKENNMLESNKQKLYDTKISETINALNNIQEKYKEEYFDRLQRDYKEMVLNDEINKDFISNLSDYNHKQLEMIIISENYYEYQLLKKTYYNMNDYYRILVDRNYYKQVQEKQNRIKETND